MENLKQINEIIQDLEKVKQDLINWDLFGDCIEETNLIRKALIMLKNEEKDLKDTTLPYKSFVHTDK